MKLLAVIGLVVPYVLSVSSNGSCGVKQVVSEQREEDNILSVSSNGSCGVKLSQSLERKMASVPFSIL